MSMSIEDRFSDFVTDNGKKLLYVVLGVIALFVLVLRFAGGKEQETISDYLNADVSFSHFQERSDVNGLGDSFDTLSKIINKHPELHAKYDGLIAQTLIIRDYPQEAETFENLAIGRTEQDHLAPYLDYAKTTLLSAKGSYFEALAMAQALKQKLEANTDLSNETLKANNLIRIAFLTQQVGTPAEQKNAWNDLDKWMKSASNNPQSQKALNSLKVNFQEGDISLSDYINKHINT